MKAQNIVIDINQLSTDQLEMLAEIVATGGKQEDWANKVKAINYRKAYNLGWMPPDVAAVYRNRYLV